MTTQTDIITLDYAFGGQPFCDVGAVDATLDLAFSGRPFVVDTSAGTVYSVSVSEAATATDAAAAGLAAVDALTEAATSTDTWAGPAVMEAAISESASADDAVASSGAVASVSVSESASATDDVSATADLVAALTETATASDAPVSSIAYAVIITDAASASDAVDRALVFVSALTEAAAAGDEVAADILLRAARPNMWVHEIELPGVDTFVVGSGSLVTGAADTPAKTIIHALLKDPGLVRQEVSSGRTAGVVSPSYGDAVYSNLQGDFDYWVEYATDGGKVTCRYGPRGGNYPSEFTTDFIAYIDGAPRVNERTMTLGLRDRTQIFGAPVVTEGFDGSGDLQGTAAAGSLLRRLIFGQPGFPQPTLIDALNNVWYVQKNFQTGENRVFDGGVELTNLGAYLSSAGLFLGGIYVPGPSCFKYWAGTEGVYLRLGSKARIDLRIEADSPSWTISDLAIEAGATDAATMAADSEDFSLGSRVVEHQTFRQVLDDVAAAQIAVIGFNRADEFFSRRIVPSTASDYDTDMVFTVGRGGNADQLECYPPSGLARRVKQVTVQAGATVKGQIAGIPDVDAAALEVMKRDNWITTFTGSSDAVEGDTAETVAVQIEENFFADDSAAMQDWIERFINLHGTRQVWYWLRADYTEETAALQLLDRVRVLSPRFQCAAGQYARIWSIERQLAARKIRFGLWSHHTSIDAGDIVLSKVDDAVADGVSGGSGAAGTRGLIKPSESMVVACSDKTTPLTVGLVNDIPSFPYDLRLAAVELGLTTAQASGATFEVDVQVYGVSVFSTLPTIDNALTKSVDSTTQPVLTTFDIPAGALVEFYVTAVGDGTAAGLTVNLIGYQ